jgi:hypothetical protein
MLAVALSIGGGAYASAQAAGGGPGANLSSHLPALHPVHHSAGSPAAPIPGPSFHPLTLANGWQSENASFGTGDPKVALQNGVVYLKGSLAQPTPGSTTFTVLPTADRPHDTLLINVWTSGGNLGTLEIATNGRMAVVSNTPCGSGNTAQCLTSLAAISFPLGS